MTKTDLLHYFERKEARQKQQKEHGRPRRKRKPLEIDEKVSCLLEVNGLNYEFFLQVRQVGGKAEQIDRLSAAQNILAWSHQDPHLQQLLTAHRTRVKNQLGLALQHLVIGLLIDEISTEQALIESLVAKLAQHNVRISLI
ncbi:hypothetical protein [Rodentibacter pneumotropicus]|uniref:hypothetical protein n=1 Tax=Rodentibacter pneumotropicus TaxID=758 RepID=UPI00109D0689|nr:hypothetical protein [Rodentibacter pneumotropicus]NBH76220.1 hypothetical protein [Rodentibacter pneumotropicus]THA08323.1 hypothetical protein D3M73_00055 [Rodentibacter pneumotropicus]THA12546.1 hypothetical protein D3M81_04870 [Rodentibacter pneumotropicus]THA16675.1 hypothetical protein D3M82_02445 [Rodentibacter pneumotropicus]